MTHPNTAVSPKAATAIDLLIQTITAFQTQLAPLDATCTNLTDVLSALKTGGTVTPEMITRAQQTSQALSGLDRAIVGLKMIEPLLDLIQQELLSTL